MATFSLIVEDGTGTLVANSYAAIADGDNYHLATMQNVSLWSTAADDVKGPALALATRLIDANMQWRGFRTTTTQTLDWPRQRVKNPDAYVFTAGTASALSGMFYDANSLPKRVVDATCQCALDLLATPARAVDRSDKDIAKISIGSGALSIDFDKKDQITTLSDTVILLLRKLGIPRSLQGGVVNVYRT